MADTLDQLTTEVGGGDVGGGLFAKILAESAPEDADDETKVEEPVAEVVEEQDAEETVVEEKIKDSPPAGVTPGWRATAKTAGVPEALIDFCVNDDQLQQLITLRGSEREQPKPETESVPLLSMLIPEEDFDDRDPLHKQVKHVVDATNRELSSLNTDLNALFGEVKQLVKGQQSQYQAKLDQQYDAAADSFGEDFLGQSGSPARQEAYDLFRHLVDKYPNEDAQKLGVRALRATHESLVNTRAIASQQDALEKQKKQKLGGGPSPKPVNPPADPMNEFREQLRGWLTDG